MQLELERPEAFQEIEAKLRPHRLFSRHRTCRLCTPFRRHPCPPSCCLSPEDCSNLVPDSCIVARYDPSLCRRYIVALSLLLRIPAAKGIALQDALCRGIPSILSSPRPCLCSCRPFPGRTHQDLLHQWRSCRAGTACQGAKGHHYFPKDPAYPAVAGLRPPH